MKLRKMWSDFWFGLVPPGPVGLVRVAMGILVIIAALQLWPDRFVWFSEYGLVTSANSEAYNAVYTPGPRDINFHLIHVTSDNALNIFFVFYFLAAACMTVGLWTRPAIFLVWLGMNCMHNRCSINNTTGGDCLMMAMTIYLFLAKSDAAFSVSRLLRVHGGREGYLATPIPVWPQRLMQIQVCLVYICTFLAKMTGEQWRDGTAVYYPYTVLEFHRFPMPFIDADHLWFVRLLTYGTLGVEVMLFSLIWVPRFRLTVLAMGLALHMGIEYMLNIPLFEWLMAASFISFLTQRDLETFKAWLGRKRTVAPVATLEPSLQPVGRDS